MNERSVIVSIVMDVDVKGEKRKSGTDRSLRAFVPSVQQGPVS